jgi:hypothetical protein
VPRFLPRGAVLPLGDGLLIDAMALGQRSQALLTMLYQKPAPSKLGSNI